MSSSIMARLLILFLLGGLAGWCFAPSSRDKQETTVVAAPARPPAGKGGPRSELPRSPEDFARWVQEKAAGYSPVPGFGAPYHAQELGDWSVEELRAALDQGLADPGASREYSPARSALSALLGEWTKRDPDAAWTWLARLPRGPTRTHLSGAIAQSWPEDRIAEGLELAMANVEDFTSPNWRHYHRLLMASAEAAAKRGSAELDELLSRTHGSGMQLPPGGLNFPPGFDFAGLIRAPFMASQMAERGLPYFVSEGWLRADADAAVRGLMALDRQAGGEAGASLFYGLSRADAELGRKAGVAIGKMPLEEQRGVFAAEGLKRFHAEPDVYRALIDGLPDASVRDSANLAFAEQMLRSSKLPAALPFIEAGSAPDERIANLEACVERVKQSGGRLGYADEHEKIREALVSWQADEQQIDRIMAKLR